MVYRLTYYRYRYRYIFSKFYRGVSLLIFLILVAAVIWALPPTEVCSRYAGIITTALLEKIVCWDKVDQRVVLRTAVPLMSSGGGNVGPGARITPESTLVALLAPLKGELGDYAALLKRGMPLLGTASQHSAPAAAPAQGLAAGEGRQAVLTDKALVAIYHTHTSETYALSDGSEHLPGASGGVVEVGSALKEELEKRYGIRAVHSERVNDASYSASYGESEKNARQLLEENPGILIMIDIHRDAGKSRESCLIKVNGQEVAPLLFVVGSDARAPFPSWRQNLALAQKLQGLLDKRYPGLCQGVRVKEGRYNQYLHPGMLLVEVGSVNNYTFEAVQSAKVLAAVLAEVLADKVGAAQQGAEAYGGEIPGNGATENFDTYYEEEAPVAAEPEEGLQMPVLPETEEGISEGGTLL